MIPGLCRRKGGGNTLKSAMTVCAASDAARAHFDAGGKRGGERGTLVIGSAYGVRGV